MGSRGGFCEGV